MTWKQAAFVLAFLTVLLGFKVFLLSEDRSEWRRTAYRATDALEVCTQSLQNSNSLNGTLLQVIRNPPRIPDREQFLAETD